MAIFFSQSFVILFRSLTSGTYTLQNNITLEKYEVYCHMAEISGCGKGAWTLVMKMDGSKVKNKSSDYRVHISCFQVAWINHGRLVFLKYNKPQISLFCM